MCIEIQQIQEQVGSLLTGVATINQELLALRARLERVDSVVDDARSKALPPLHSRIVAMLRGEYRLRTMQALIDGAGATRDEIVNALTDAGVEFVLRRRREDGAELVGLAERN